jgi:hypothetical protein
VTGLAVWLPPAASVFATALYIHIYAIFYRCVFQRLCPGSWGLSGGCGRGEPPPWAEALLRKAAAWKNCRRRPCTSTWGGCGLVRFLATSGFSAVGSTLSLAGGLARLTFWATYPTPLPSRQAQKADPAPRGREEGCRRAGQSAGCCAVCG